MTEELEKEVTEYLNTQTLPRMDSFNYRVIKNLIFSFAEPREKRIAELEAQIEKMKCCGNCKHFDFNEPNYCHKGVYRERQYVCSKWEFGN